MKSWLVQRGEFKIIKDNDIIGMDSLITWDYMGSAEFEFGALPQSLKRMVKEFNQYQLFEIKEVKTKKYKSSNVYILQ